MTRNEFARLFPIKVVSTSNRACIATFIDGPAVGRRELQDFPEIARVFWCKGCSWTYTPTMTANGPEYRLDRKATRSTSRSGKRKDWTL